MAMKLIILCAIGFLFGCNCLCPSPEETKTIDLKLVSYFILLWIVIWHCLTNYKYQSKYWFNLKLEGKWWVIASTPVNKNNVTGECITFDVSFHSDTKEFKINFTEFNSIRKMSVYWEVIGKQLEQNRLEGSWQLLNSPRKISKKKNICKSMIIIMIQLIYM